MLLRLANPKLFPFNNGAIFSGFQCYLTVTLYRFLALGSVLYAVVYSSDRILDLVDIIRRQGKTSSYFLSLCYFFSFMVLCGASLIGVFGIFFYRSFYLVSGWIPA